MSFEDPFSNILILVAIGFAMVAAEVFVPGMVLGILGSICLIGAVAISYVEYGPLVGTISLFAIGTVNLIGFIIWIRIFPKTFVGKKLMLSSSLEPGGGKDPKPYLGKEGKALTPLRPSGTAFIEGKRVDVVTESGFIERGSPIRVVRQEGSTVVVRKQ